MTLQKVLHGVGIATQPYGAMQVPMASRTRTVRVWVLGTPVESKLWQILNFSPMGARPVFGALALWFHATPGASHSKEEMKRLVDQALYVTPQQTAGSNSDSPATDPVQLLKDLEAAAHLARRQKKVA